MPLSPARIAAALVPSLLLLSRPALAQGNEYVAFAALNATPPGALVPIAIGSRIAGPWSVAVRYGRISSSRVRTFHHGGLTLDYGLAGGRGAVTLGANHCNGCDPILNAAFDYERVISSSMQSGGELTVSLKPALGYGHLMGELDFGIFSASLGLPIALRTGSSRSDLSVMPYVVPALGGGAFANFRGGSDGGLRPILGGGVRLDWKQRQTGLFVGFQKVFIEDGKTVIGGGFSVNAGNPL